MSKQFISVVALCVVVALVLMSCTPGPQNTNQNQSQNQNQGQRAATAETQDATSSDNPSDDDICKETDIKKRIEALDKKLKYKIESNKGKLWDQLNGVEIQGKKSPPSFAFKFYPYPANAEKPTYVYLVIAGTVHERKPFEDLAEYAEDFVRNHCADQVFFVGALPREGEEMNLVDGEPFQWSACEYPLQLCTDGECKLTCVKTFKGRAEPAAGSDAAKTAESSNKQTTAANNGTNK